jgi:hypothetical protein
LTATCNLFLPPLRAGCQKCCKSASSLAAGKR